MHDPNADPASPRRAHVRSAPVATMIGAEFAARVRGVPDADLVFPASNPRPIIWPRLSGPDYLAPIIWHRFARIPVGTLPGLWRVRDAIDNRRALTPRP